MKRFLMPRDGEENYYKSSRVEPKRDRQWFMEDTGLNLSSNKKPALEAVHWRPIFGISNMNVSPWDGNSSFQPISAQFNNSLFGSEPFYSVNHVDRNILSARSGNMNTMRKDFEDEYVNSRSLGLSMSHTTEDPFSYLNVGGMRNFQMNQVKESDKRMPIFLGRSYYQVDRNTNLMGTNYSNTVGDTISLVPKFNENTIPSGHTFSKPNETSMSMGHYFNKGDGGLVWMDHNYDKQGSIFSNGQAFNKEDGSFMSIGSSYYKGHENVNSMTSDSSEAYEIYKNLISKHPLFSNDNENIIPMATTNYEVNANVMPFSPTSDKGESSILSMNENDTIAVGGLNEESDTIHLGKITNSCDAAQLPQVPDQKDSVESNAFSVANNPPKDKSKIERVSKKKEAKERKKLDPNNFPTNVKNLLSTGLFEGLPVKYVSWSREKSARGTIQGTGYMCGCKDCMFSKSLNSFEFENHAGGKTKHPNDRIYFESGKTVYGVVQQLKKTPPEMLFDTIQNITGSAINQKIFETWKASYIAASRELQRIYGKDEVALPSKD